LWIALDIRKCNSDQPGIAGEKISSAFSFYGRERT